MSVSDIILEMIKHLPGQHEQLRHAGLHAVSSVSQNDLDDDIRESNWLRSLMTDASIRKIEDYIATKMDLQWQSITNYPREGFAEERLQHIEELMKNPDFLAGLEAINEFKRVALDAKRYYRGVGIDRVKDLIKKGVIQPYTAVKTNEYYGKDFEPDTSMSLNPNVSKKFGPFTLIIDAAKARHHGAEPVNYLEFDKDSVDDIFCYYKDLEVRTEQDLPNSAILGVITPNGDILSLGKK